MGNLGAFGLLLLLPAIAALGTLVERFFVLRLRLWVDRDGFMRAIQKLVLADQVGQAVGLCREAPHAAVSRIVKAALSRVGQTPAALDLAIREAHALVRPEWRRRSQLLGVLSRAAFILATIVAALSLRSALLAGGPELTVTAAQALLLFGLGALVAILALAAQAWVTSVIEALEADAARAAVEIEALLVARMFGSPAAL